MTKSENKQQTMCAKSPSTLNQHTSTAFVLLLLLLLLLLGFTFPIKACARALVGYRIYKHTHIHIPQIQRIYESFASSPIPPPTHFLHLPCGCIFTLASAFFMLCSSSAQNKAVKRPAVQTQGTKSYQR